jgi:hypothetical protein
MGGGTHIFLRILMLTVLAIVFFFAAVILRPYLPHRHHKASYLLLKTSYLIYLLVLFSFLYFLTFYPGSLEEFFTNTLFFTLLVTLFLPSAAMLARKKVRKKRSFYNYFFTIFHLLTAIFYILIWNNILSLNG